jgi:hypothetical protein
MKTIKFFALLLIFVGFYSCSSDDDGGGGQSVDQDQYFTYVEDATDYPIEYISALRTENVFELVAEGEGRSIYLNFDKWGQLILASSDNTETFEGRTSQYYYSQESFNFEIVAIDEAEKIIKVTYSGKLYEDQWDPESDYVQVSGTANVTYIENNVDPAFANMGVTAKIGSAQWRAVKSETTDGWDGIPISVHAVGEDRWKITFRLDTPELSAGTISFTSASTNRVYLSRYNPATGSFTEYQSSGTLVIDELVSSGWGSHIIRGSFTFTATNPDDNSVVQVQNGVFKQFYNH